MIGMLQIITYLLCVYLVFKGYEIFQIAFMSNREKRGGGLAIGICAIIISFIAATVFIYLINSQAKSISDSLPKW
jgi:uncharacterized membrane protein (DUF485 family)